MEHTRTSAPELFDGPGEMRARCRTFDWAATPLGPVDRWSPALRTAAQMVLAAGLPCILLWGREIIQLYNDAYSEIIGAKHPAALGHGNAAVWPEVWHLNGPIFERVFAGETVTLENALYPLDRADTREDVYLTISFSPIRDETGAVAGVLANMLETTSQVALRRLEAERSELVHSLEVERARLAEVFRNSPSYLAVLGGPDYVFEMVNEAYYQLVGHRELLGRPAFEALPELRGQGFEALLDGVRTTGEPFVGREIPILVARTPDAPPELRYLDFVYLRMGGDAGARSRIVAHGTDVTDHVLARRDAERAREHAARLQALTAALSRATTPEEVADVVVARGVEATGAATGMLALLVAHRDGGRRSGAAAEAVILRQVGLPAVSLTEYARFSLDAPGPAAECLRTGEPVFVESRAELLARFPEIPHLWDAMGTHALATVPLVVGEEMVGAMSFTFAEPRTLAEDNREFFLALGRQCAIALERARLFGAIGEREAELRTLADTMPTLAWMANADGWIFWYNRRWYEYTGTRPEDMEGWGWQAVHDPEALPRVLESWTASLATGAPFEMEFPLRGADGRFRAFLTRIVPVRDGEGRVVRWFGTNTDVESMRESQAALERAVDRTTRLQRLSAALAAAVTLDEVTRAAVEEGIAALGADAGIVVLLDERRRALHIAHAAGLEPGVAERWREFPLDAEVPLAEAVRTRRPVILGTLAGREARDQTRTTTHETSVSVPFVVEGVAVGGLGLTFVRARAVHESDVELLVAMGGQCAQAVRRATLFAALADAERRAQFLADASGRLGGSLDYEETLGTVARLAVPQFADYCVVDVVDEDGALRRVAQAHADPAKEEIVRASAAVYPVVAADPRHPIRAALEAGEARLVERVDETWIRRAARGHPEYEAMLRALAPRSIVMAPLVSRGEALGMVTAVTSDSGRRYDATDVAVVAELARRAGSAVDRARLYRMAEAARGEAERARREAASIAKTDFLRTLSHESRTPLNAAISYVDLLGMELYGPLTDGQRDALERVGRAHRRLLALVNDVLDIERVEAGAVEYDIRPVRLATALAEAAELMAAQFDAKRVRFERPAPPDGLTVLADAEKLEQVVLNLLSNALKHTESGGRVALTAEPQDGEAVVLVQDTGAGIPPDKHEAIFRPFVRVDASHTRQTEGVGLGLAISRAIARGMGGELAVRSTVGEGSLFTLRLPAAAAARPGTEDQA